MAITRQQKEEIIAQTAERLESKKMAVLTDFRGLSAEDATALRKKLGENEIDYKVIKISLLSLASKKLNLGLPIEEFKNHPLAIAFGQDEVATAKIVRQFSKEHEALKIIGGILEKVYIPASQIETLALLPSREELYAKVVGSLAAPLSGMVNVLQGNLRNLVYILSAYQKQRS